MQSFPSYGSKRNASCLSPCESLLIKRARLDSSAQATLSSGSESSEWFSVCSEPRLLDQRSSPCTIFATPPPESHPLNSSPFSFKHVKSTSPIFGIHSAESFSPFFLGSFDVNVDQIMTPEERTPVSVSSLCSTASVQTPPRKECQPTCFCRGELDTFGKRPQMGRNQLGTKTFVLTPIFTPGDATNIHRLLVPRTAWGKFSVSRTPPADGEKARKIVYQGSGNVTVVNEDLWVDKNNPFLLTRFDLGELSPRKGVLDDVGAMSPLFRDSGVGLGMFLNEAA